MAASLIPLTWKLKQGAAPKSGGNQVDGFNPSRFVKVEPSASGPGGTDTDIKSRLVYNEGLPSVTEYYVEDTVAEIIALVNANVIAV